MLESVGVKVFLLERFKEVPDALLIDLKEASATTLVG